MEKIYFFYGLAAALITDYRRFQQSIVRESEHSFAHVLLAHDPRLKYETARIAVGINSGSFQDGEVEGVAHFFEHSAFLGSQRYSTSHLRETKSTAPSQADNKTKLTQVSEFDYFLETVGGTTNAATFPTHTIFTCIVPFAELEPALARLMDMIEAPCLDANAVTKEIMAVDAEHQKNLRDSAHIVWQTLLSFFTKPLSRFSTGDKESLSIENVTVSSEDSSNLCVRGSAMELPLAVKALHDYYKDKVDGCKLVVVVLSDMPLSQVESKVNPLIRSALKDCKTSSTPERPLSAGDWIDEHTEILPLSRRAYLPISLHPLTLSVIHLVPYFRDQYEHPELLPAIEALFNLHLKEILKENIKAQLSPPILLDCMCEVNTVDINPIRLLSFDCRFYSALPPSPDVIELYRAYSEAAILQYAAKLQEHVIKGRLSQVLNTVHDLQQIKKSVFPKPKMSTTSALIEFCKAFMVNLNQSSRAESYSGIVNYIEGSSETPVDSEELAKVLEAIKSNKFISLTITNPANLGYVQSSLDFLKHYNEHYDIYFYEHRSNHLSTTPALNIRSASELSQTPECGISADLDSVASPYALDDGIWISNSGAISELRLTLKFGDVDLDNDHATSKFDSKQASVYVWALETQYLMRSILDDLRFCLGDASVDASQRRNMITIQYRSPSFISHNQVRKFLEFIQQRIINLPEKINRSDLIRFESLIVKDITSEEISSAQSFKNLMTHLEEALDPSKLTRREKLWILSNLKNLDYCGELRTAFQKLRVQGLITGFDDDYEITKLLKSFDRDSTTQTRKLHIPSRDITVDLSSVEDTDVLMRDAEDDGHDHGLIDKFTSMTKFEVNVCARATSPNSDNHGDFSTALLQFIAIPIYKSPNSRFVRLYDEETSIMLNRLTCKCMAQKLSTYLFDKLRNSEHVGYVVDASFLPGDRKFNGILLRIQSPRYKGEHLIKRITQALGQFPEICNAEELKQSLADSLQFEDDPFKRFDSSYNWLELGFSPNMSHQKIVEQLIAHGNIDPAFYEIVHRALRESGRRLTFFATTE